MNKRTYRKIEFAWWVASTLDLGMSHRWYYIVTSFGTLFLAQRTWEILRDGEKS